MPFIRVTTPAPVGVWTEVLGEDPRATLMQTPQWLAMAATVSGDTDASRLYEYADGRRLVLPLLRRRWAPGLTTQGAYPPSYGQGGLVASGGLRPADVTAVLEDLRRGPAVSTRLSANYDATAIWEAGNVRGVVRVPRRVHVLDLEGGPDAVWHRRYRSSTRRAVRKAEAADVTVECDTSGSLVDDFYELYRTWTATRARRGHLPPALASYTARRREPLAKIRQAAALPGGMCRIWMARLEGRPVAAIITLVRPPYAYFWRGYSDQDSAGPVRANNLLHHRAVLDAIDSGCRSYNMGESGGVEALERFKETFGATPRPLPDLRVERLPVSTMERAIDRARSRVLESLRHIPAGLVRRSRGQPN